MYCIYFMFVCIWNTVCSVSVPWLRSSSTEATCLWAFPAAAARIGANCSWFDHWNVPLAAACRRQIGRNKWVNCYRMACAHLRDTYKYIQIHTHIWDRYITNRYIPIDTDTVSSLHCFIYMYLALLYQWYALFYLYVSCMYRVCIFKDTYIYIQIHRYIQKMHVLYVFVCIAWHILCILYVSACIFCRQKC